MGKLHMKMLFRSFSHVPKLNRQFRSCLIC